MDHQKSLGIYPDNAVREENYQALKAFTRIKLKALGLPVLREEPASHQGLMRISEPLIEHFREQFRMLQGELCPADRRIQNFLNRYFADYCEDGPTLPLSTFILDRHGLARTLSIPANKDQFESDIITSYRIKQGVLHNPIKDRRTTHGVFHVAEGGLPIPDDKKAVPQLTAARLLKAAFCPPESIQKLPYHDGEPEAAHCWVSLLLRPMVSPEVPEFLHRKSMEIRFFAPGNLVSNLDFVESIFGNAGDPYLSQNDAGLDILHWTGHTGCVVLAPHLTRLTKKELGLPPADEATERQRRDGMCWESEDERYNDGGAFKITCRDRSGVIVTAISDNYFGYCKKEVKTQIGFAANQYGLCEEEHAGGALVFSSYDLGEDFRLSRYYKTVDHRFEEALSVLGDQVRLEAEGYAVDLRRPDICYVPEDVVIKLDEQSISWYRAGQKHQIRLEADKVYVLPSGYKVEMVRPHLGRRWRLKGTTAQASYCHKPCTVSGGGKSEISKPITDAIITGPVFVRNIQEDFDQVEAIIARDYRDRFRNPELHTEDSRSLLSEERSLGSVIKLLTPSEVEYSDAYNAWLSSIPEYIKDLVFTLKRLYRKEWESQEDHWRNRFSVDTVNGKPGNELRYRGRKLQTQYLRVGYLPDGSWRIFQLRRDFMPAEKLSMEDDITASVVSPKATLPDLQDSLGFPSLKYAENCEFRFFQRPDDAIIRGYDKQAEADLAGPDAFLSNYEPLTEVDAREQGEDVIRFDNYTPPMRELISGMARGEGPTYFCSSANPRIVDGKPTKNPRYLQLRPDIVNERDRYLAEVSTRLFYRLPPESKPIVPVTAILAGRRNNPPDPENDPPIRPLCVYNPIHYMELPELFMEFIASITGKSPSTTGAGSEGALTKAPFNALLPVHDLNSALVSFILCGYPAFLSSAGYVGPRYRVDHDVSLLIPEIWCRMRLEEQKASFLLEGGYLERCEDFEYEGKTVQAGRLGYRINEKFVNIFCGRLFTNPKSVFPEELLKPELQDRGIFADGVDNIVTAHQWVAERYFRDGSYELACPPLQALLSIMAKGHWNGKGLEAPEVRDLFDREKFLASEWYAQRLRNRQRNETELWERHIDYLSAFMEKPFYQEVARSLDCESRLKEARHTLERVRSPERVKELEGTLGSDSFD